MITGEREATLIQCVAVLGRGVKVLKSELKQGNFNSSRDTASLLEALVQLADQIITTARRENATPPGDGPDPAAAPG